MGDDWGGDLRLRRGEEGKRRECAPSERKSPPFAERREGWGTLKFKGEVGLGEEPKTHTQRRRVGHPAKVRDHERGEVVGFGGGTRGRKSGGEPPHSKLCGAEVAMRWGVRVGRGWRRSAGPRLCGRFRRGRGLAEWLRWPFAPGDRLREGS